MKSKRILISVAIMIVALAVFFSVSSNVLLWSGIYSNNNALDRETNREIKNLLLNAIKDRCSILHSIDQDRIYDMASKEHIIQLQEDNGENKKMICVIDLYLWSVWKGLGKMNMGASLRITVWTEICIMK